jgi:hypothetical protein
VERCIQLFVLTVHFRFQDYEYVSFQPFALLPHWHYPHVTTLCIVTHFGPFLQPFSSILCEKNIEIWIILFSPWNILFSPYSWHFSMFYVCFVGKDEKLNDSIDDDDCFDEQIYLTNFCSFKLFHLFLWKKLNIFKHKMNICVPLKLLRWQDIASNFFTLSGEGHAPIHP